MIDFFLNPLGPYFVIFTTSIPASRTQPCELDWKWYFIHLESTTWAVYPPHLRPSTRPGLEIQFFDFKKCRKKIVICKIYKKLCSFRKQGRLNPRPIPVRI